MPTSTPLPLPRTPIPARIQLWRSHAASTGVRPTVHQREDPSPPPPRHLRGPPRHNAGKRGELNDSDSDAYSYCPTLPCPTQPHTQHPTPHPTLPYPTGRYPRSPCSSPVAVSLASPGLTLPTTVAKRVPMGSRGPTPRASRYVRVRVREGRGVQEMCKTGCVWL